MKTESSIFPAAAKVQEQMCYLILATLVQARPQTVNKLLNLLLNQKP